MSKFGFRIIFKVYVVADLIDYIIKVYSELEHCLGLTAIFNEHLPISFIDLKDTCMCINVAGR